MFNTSSGVGVSQMLRCVLWRGRAVEMALLALESSEGLVPQSPAIAGSTREARWMGEADDLSSAAPTLWCWQWGTES